MALSKAVLAVEQLIGGSLLPYQRTYMNDLLSRVQRGEAIDPDVEAKRIAILRQQAWHWS